MVLAAQAVRRHDHVPGALGVRGGWGALVAGANRNVRVTVLSSARGQYGTMPESTVPVGVVAVGMATYRAARFIRQHLSGLTIGASTLYVEMDGSGTSLVESGRVDNAAGQLTSLLVASLHVWAPCQATSTRTRWRRRSRRGSRSSPWRRPNQHRHARWRLLLRRPRRRPRRPPLPCPQRHRPHRSLRCRMRPYAMRRCGGFSRFRRIRCGLDETVAALL